MSRTCGCNTSHKRMVKLFNTMYKAIASSGILQEDCKRHQQYPRVVNSAEKDKKEDEEEDREKQVVFHPAEDGP